MSYTKTNWVDQAGQVRYGVAPDEEDGLFIITPNYEEVTEMGTPVNAANLNHIENGIEDAFEYVDTEIAELEAQVVKLADAQTISGAKTFSSAPFVPNSQVGGTALRLVGKGGGYIKLGDGTLIQWGNESTPSSSYTKSVSLYQNYATDIYRVFLTQSGTNNNAFSDVKVYHLSSSSFAIRGSAYNLSFNWLTIGQWY